MKRCVTLLFLVMAVSAFGWGTNLIPNSSFEVGHGRGWIQFRTTDSNPLGNLNFCTEQITNNTAVHGGSSLLLYSRAFLSSRAFWALAGNYTFSWYQKSLDGGTYGASSAFVTTHSNMNLFVENYTVALTGSWTRGSTNITLSSDGFYCVHLWVPSHAYIDAVQFETGTVATAYSPNAEIECGIRLTGMYGMHFTGNTPNFDMVFRNEGAITNARAEYRLYDWLNSNYLTHSFSITLPAATNYVTNVTLPRKGHVRVLTRLYDVADSTDECKTIAYNFPSNTVGNVTNDWLGGHPHVTRFHALRDVYAGRRIARSLSPGFRNTRWWAGSATADIEFTRGSIVFDPAHSFTNWQQAGLLGLGCLTPGDTLWPTWAVVANAPGQTYHTNVNFPYIGMWDGMAWSNYCFWTTLTNKGAGGIDFVEMGPNEPYQTGPDSGPPFPDEDPAEDIWVGADNLPINTKNPTNFAKITAYGIAGVTNADPTMKIVIVAGAAGNGEWAYSVWTNLNNMYSGSVPWVYAISTHRIQHDHGFDPNDPYYLGIATSTHHPGGWMNRFRGVRPVWNTEYNTVGGTYMQGLNGLFSYDLIRDFVAEGMPESTRSELGNRQTTSTIATMTSALRDIGFGGDKFFWYSSRYFNENHLIMAPFSADLAADQNQVDKAELVALSVARHMVDAPGYGPITNLSHTAIEMYMFTNATRLWSVAVAWSADRVNRTLGLNNANVGVVDLMGNPGATNTTNICISRAPTYIVSSTLSVPQLSNTLRLCTATVTPDVIPPSVSFDIAPTGLWSGDTTKQLFKWTAIDDISVAWSANSPSKSNVVYRYKLNGGTYTPYSQSNHCWIANIPAGTNTFWVSAKDKTGNVGEYAYEFSPTGDTPIIPSGSTNLNVINVSAEINIGTITVVP